MMDWGEEKPNGEFWMLNDGLKTMLDFGCWKAAMPLWRSSHALRGSGGTR
jgi:hypothetical protein